MAGGPPLRPLRWPWGDAFIKNAADLAAALGVTQWRLFDRLIGQFPQVAAPEATAIIEQVKDALARDEHVVHLAGSLQDTQSAALALISEVVKDIPSDGQPSPRPPPRPTPPPSSNLTGSQHGLDMQRVMAIFDMIRRTLESAPDLVLDVDWRLRSKRGDIP